MSDIPKPTTEDMARDLEADLAVAAGPPVAREPIHLARNGYGPMVCGVDRHRVLYQCYDNWWPAHEAQSLAEFMLAAFAGWPAAIARARHAEALNAELLAACEKALPALERAAAELGGTGYFASKADEVRAALRNAKGA